MIRKQHGRGVTGTTHLPRGGAQRFEDKTKKIGPDLLRLRSLVGSLALAVVSILTVGFTEAATYYVAINGVDGNTCDTAQNPSTAKRTIAQGISCLSSGDTLIINGGTYDEGLYNPPSGNSSAAMTTIKGAPGETVIIKPDIDSAIIALDSPRSRISIENLTVDGNNRSSPFGVWVTASHTRFKDLEFRQIGGTVLGVFRGDDNSAETGSNEFSNIRIHDSGEACDRNSRGGCAPSHGFYVNTSFNLFDRVVVDGIPGHAIVIYDTQYTRKVGNTIHNSVFRNNSVGVGIFAGDDTIVEDNLFESSNNSGIWVSGGSVNTILRHNTIQVPGDSAINIEGSNGTQIID